MNKKKSKKKHHLDEKWIVIYSDESEESLDEPEKKQAHSSFLF